jgi:hypothetical protein
MGLLPSQAQRRRHRRAAGDAGQDSLRGTKPAPMPWILCGPGCTGSPARVCRITGLSAGSTATDTRGWPRVVLR